MACSDTVRPAVSTADALDASESKENMLRYLYQCPLLELPSVNAKTFRAILALGGRRDWQTRAPRLSDKVPADEKLSLLLAAHANLQHLGGREGLAQALKAQNKKWVNMESDAYFICKRCEHCAGVSTRGMAEPPPRHLPRPLCAGEVAGVDLKLVSPPSGARWVMLLLVDLCSNRLWAFDMDEKKKTVKEVQAVLLHWYHEVELPSIIWSENGGQFKSIVETAVERSLGLKPKHIPPGRPEANGLVETYNRVLDAASGGDRSKLMAAVAAYNSLPLRRRLASKMLGFEAQISEDEEKGACGGEALRG